MNNNIIQLFSMVLINEGINKAWAMGLYELKVFMPKRKMSRVTERKRDSAHSGASFSQQENRTLSAGNRWETEYKMMVLGWQGHRERELD